MTVPMPYQMTRQQAIDQGFTIDSSCYPNVAYKGYRLVPDEWHTVPTQTEAELFSIIYNAWSRKKIRVRLLAEALRSASCQHEVITHEDCNEYVGIVIDREANCIRFCSPDFEEVYYDSTEVEISEA